MSLNYLQAIERTVGRLSIRRIDDLAENYYRSRHRPHQSKTTGALVDLLQAVASRVETGLVLPERTQPGEIRPFYPTLMRIHDKGQPFVEVSRTRSLTFRPGPGGVAAFLKAQLLYCHHVVLADPLSWWSNDLMTHGNFKGPRERREWFHFRYAFPTLMWLRFLAECRPLIKDHSLLVIELPHNFEETIRSKYISRAWLRTHMDEEFQPSFEEQAFRARYLTHVTETRRLGFDVDYSFAPRTTAEDFTRAGISWTDHNSLSGVRVKALIDLPGFGLAGLESARLAELRRDPIFEDCRAALARGLARTSIELSNFDSAYPALARELLAEELRPCIQRIGSTTRTQDMVNAAKAAGQRITIGAAGIAGSAFTSHEGLTAAAAGTVAASAVGACWVYAAGRRSRRMADSKKHWQNALDSTSDWVVPFDFSSPGWPQDLWRKLR